MEGGWVGKKQRGSQGIYGCSLLLLSGSLMSLLLLLGCHLGSWLLILGCLLLPGCCPAAICCLAGASGANCCSAGASVASCCSATVSGSCCCCSAAVSGLHCCCSHCCCSATVFNLRCGAPSYSQTHNDPRTQSNMHIHSSKYIPHCHSLYLLHTQSYSNFPPHRAVEVTCPR